MAVGDLAGARRIHSIGSGAAVGGHTGVEVVHHGPGEQIIRKLPKMKIILRGNFFSGIGLP